MWIIQNDFHDRDFSIEFSPDELKALEKLAEIAMYTIEETLRVIINEAIEKKG